MAFAAAPPVTPGVDIRHSDGFGFIPDLVFNARISITAEGNLSAEILTASALGSSGDRHGLLPIDPPLRRRAVTACADRANKSSAPEDETQGHGPGQ
jgi:hypothetical protein